MSMSSVGRPTQPAAANSEGFRSLTGGRGLLQDEPLLFELGGWDKTGVDLPLPDHDASDLGDLVRNRADRPGRPLRARDDAPLRAPVPEETTPSTWRSIRWARAP